VSGAYDASRLRGRGAEVMGTMHIRNAIGFASSASRFMTGTDLLVDGGCRPV